MYHNTTQNVSTWILHQLSIDMKLPRLVLSMTMYHQNPKECDRKYSVEYVITPAWQKYGRVGHIHKYVYK